MIFVFEGVTTNDCGVWKRNTGKGFDNPTSVCSIDKWRHFQNPHEARDLCDERKYELKAKTLCVCSYAH